MANTDTGTISINYIKGRVLVMHQTYNTRIKSLYQRIVRSVGA